MSYFNQNFQGSTLPTDSAIFKQEIINEVQALNEKNPPMERLLGTVISVDIDGIEFIETEVGISNEGQKLTGTKLLVKLRLQEKTTYVGDHKTQPVHAEYFESRRNFFVILPEKIDGLDFCEYQDRLIVTPYIEDVETRMLDDRHLQKCIMIFIDVRVSK
ncbi:MAG: hypothetical protein R3Y53_02380 [Bacillota bacterium]